MDMGGTSDPYVSVTTSANPSSGTKTEVKKKELNPKWNASLDIPVEDPSSEKLMVEVFDWDRMKGDETWNKLVGSSQGEIHLKITATDFGEPEDQFPEDKEPQDLVTFSGEMAEEREERKKKEKEKKGEKGTMDKVNDGMKQVRGTSYSAKKAM